MQCFGQISTQALHPQHSDFFLFATDMAEKYYKRLITYKKNLLCSFWHPALKIKAAQVIKIAYKINKYKFQLTPNHFIILTTIYPNAP